MVRKDNPKPKKKFGKVSEEAGRKNKRPRPVSKAKYNHPRRWLYELDKAEEE